MLTPPELSRYSRHIRLDEVGPVGQERLLASRVLVIGMGGLGSPASFYLAAAGVGTLGLADFDTVEMHNLQRQILHTEARVGTPKLDSALERLTALNPTVNYIRHAEGVTHDNAIDLFKQYDVIVDGTDNFPTRYLVNDAAFFAQKPLVYGSIFQFEGQVSLFNPHDNGPCYRCLFPNIPAPGTVPNCDQAGVFGALCGVVGSFQAMEAIKYIAQMGQLLQGRLVVLDSLHMHTRTLKLKKDPDCPLCGHQPSIQHIDADNYRFRCQPETDTTHSATMEISINQLDHYPNATFLDVREAFEVDICKIDGALHIPLSQIPQQHPRLTTETPLIVYCHHGMRSLRATEYLHSVGKTNAVSLMGGIDAWAVANDPQMARY